MSPARTTPRAARGSLRRGIFALTGGIAVVAVAITALLLVRYDQTRRELAEATRRWVLEVRIADDVVQGVLRQFAIAATDPLGEATSLTTFEDAGQDVVDGMRRYLFEDLRMEQRLQIERVREAHQQMEVQAIRAAELRRRGETEAAEEARRLTVRYTLELLDELDAFLMMREDDLGDLAARNERASTMIVLTGLLLAAALFGGALLFGGFLHRRVTGPLSDLTDATRRIMEGDLEARVPTGYDSEIDALAVGFNRMAERVAEGQRDRERRNEELSTALEQLRLAQDELIQSEKLSAMGRMTAGVAHELNNPLATVLGNAELLTERLGEGGDIDAREVREAYLTPLITEAMRARSLVKSMLQFARGARTEVEAVGLRRVIDLAVSLRRHAFTQAGVDLHVGEIPDVSVVAEEERMQAVVLNLVNNALDAMAPARSGCLRIHGSVQDGVAEIRFEDDGPGLAEPARVFEPFYTTKEPGAGIGLGLALAERFMSGFGGSIQADSRPGGGTVFRLRFNVAEVPEEPGLEPPAEEGQEVRPQPPDASGGKPDRGGGAVQLVLVVEDEAHLRKLHERVLKRLGVAAHVAESAAQARAFLEEHTYAAVLCDVRMPDESGGEFYEHLKEEHPRLAERFLFVTGDISTPELGDMADRHPEMFLFKPFTVDEYAERVAYLLADRPDPAG